MMTNSEHDTLCAAVAVYGKESRVTLALEEAGELLTAIGHYSRGRCGLVKIAEEAADVSVVLGQLAIIFRCDASGLTRAATPMVEGTPMDALCEALCTLAARLMQDRRGGCHHGIVVAGIFRAFDALSVLLGSSAALAAEYAEVRAAKLERLRGRIAAKLAEETPCGCAVMGRAGLPRG